MQAHYDKIYLMLKEPCFFIQIKPLYHLFSIKTHDFQVQMEVKWTGIIKLGCENLFPFIECTTCVQSVFHLKSGTIPFINQSFFRH